MDEKILPNVDFLSELTQLEYLNLGRKSYENLNGIEKLVNLEYLDFEGICEESLDLSKLTKLQDLFVLYNKKIQNMFDCVNLKRLVIHHYKKKNTDEFTKLKKLKILEIWSSPIQNIDGLMDLKEIERLELRYLSKLESIDGIKNNTSIKELWIQNCKKVKDWEVLGTLSNLKVLTIEACGNIPSLEFLNKLESLESIRFVSNTFIEDGKLAWLIEKESMKYFNTPIEDHYDISRETL
ncbi:leucine-rich repeat domain-containing protein, partial [Lysinibacillus mangiferihumi]|uniref:leucine-rich repeat domain-containing protein n=1 Tax=Lysinibacillus mangiferihumi TaxID=1130819 RepID=UPI000D3AEE26